MKYTKLVFSAEDKRDLLPAWKDYVNHYRKEYFSINKVVDASKTLDEKTALIDKLACAKIDELANVPSGFISREQKAQHPSYVWAFNQVINSLIDYVLPSVVSEDFAGFSNVQVIGRGNTATFDVKSADLFYVSVNGNSRRHVNAQRQFSGTMSLTPVNHTVTVMVDRYRVMAGEESLAEYALKIIMSIESEIALDITYAMQESFNTVSANFKETGYTQKTFKEIATRVTAANGNVRSVALGTEIGLSNILPENDYLKMGLGQDYVKVGYLPVFLGTPLAVLSQAIDWSSADYDFAISNDYIYFVSPATQKLIQIVFDDNGLVITDDEFTNGDLTQKTSYHKGWAVGLITNAKHGVMKLQ